MTDIRKISEDELTVKDVRKKFIREMKELPGVSGRFKMTVEPGHLTESCRDAMKKAVVDFADTAGSAVRNLHINSNRHLTCITEDNVYQTFEHLAFNKICGICGGPGRYVLMGGMKMTRCERHERDLSVNEDSCFNLVTANRTAGILERYGKDWGITVITFYDILSKDICGERVIMEPPLKGHINLVYHLCRKIYDIDKNNLPVMTDMKYGRSGGLEMSFDGLNEEMSDFVDLAEELSKEVCGMCSSLKDPGVECCPIF